MARQAVLWYQSGHRDQADRAIESLQHRQRHRAPYLWKGLRGKSADAFLAAGWTTKYYLDAALLRVKAAFEDQWASFPEEIDPADGRMRAVRTWFEDLPRDARVADVGCGRGRFLKRLADEFPEARLTGVDVSPAMLRELPAGIEPLEGSLLDIPAADATLDGALAVESLEHALLPERAVAELCRIVRPGGRVLIIDKHVAKQSLSEHDPWERWFSPEELTAWLRPWCDDVTVAPVSHTEGRGGEELFLAASGRRRA